LRSLLADRLGRAPSRTYLYGFSSGGMVGRLINYKPGVNADDAGRAVFDGIIADDAGGGFWLPRAIVDGQDAVLTRPEDRARFVKQIDLTHQLYESAQAFPALANKRENARLLEEKGLGDKHRMYEIRGVSHFDAGYGPEDLGRGRDLTFQNLDLSGLIDAMIDRLDAWVETGTPPPATRSDVASLSDTDGDGKIDRPAIALPEVACPLGVYHTYPPSLGRSPLGIQVTGFAAYDGANMEPLDARGQLVDMNGNGVRDRRETVAQAWQRLGLLKEGEAFSRAKYEECVSTAAAKLVREGFLPTAATNHYVEMAARSAVR
jgi:hypothetical protein